MELENARSTNYVIVNSKPLMYEKIINGKVFYIDPTFNPQEYANLKSKVVADFPKLGLKKGDMIYHHYLALSEDNQLDGDYYTIPPSMVFLKLLNDIPVMVTDFILVIPKIIIKTFKAGLVSMDSTSETWGTVAYSNNCDLTGKEVMFPENCAFVNEIEGKEYYLMEEKDLLAQVNEVQNKERQA